MRAARERLARSHTIQRACATLKLFGNALSLRIASHRSASLFVVFGTLEQMNECFAANTASSIPRSLNYKLRCERLHELITSFFPARPNTRGRFIMNEQLYAYKPVEMLRGGSRVYTLWPLIGSTRPSSITMLSIFIKRKLAHRHNNKCVRHIRMYLFFADISSSLETGGRSKRTHRNISHLLSLRRRRQRVLCVSRRYRVFGGWWGGPSFTVVRCTCVCVFTARVDRIKCCVFNIRANQVTNRFSTCAR